MNHINALKDILDKVHTRYNEQIIWQLTRSHVDRRASEIIRQGCSRCRLSWEEEATLTELAGQAQEERKLSLCTKPGTARCDQAQPLSGGIALQTTGYKGSESRKAGQAGDRGLGNDVMPCARGSAGTCHDARRRSPHQLTLLFTVASLQSTLGKLPLGKDCTGGHYLLLF